jgi:hypothetical protein
MPSCSGTRSYIVQRWRTRSADSGASSQPGGRTRSLRSQGSSTSKEAIIKHAIASTAARCARPGGCATSATSCAAHPGRTHSSTSAIMTQEKMPRCMSAAIEPCSATASPSASQRMRRCGRGQSTSAAISSSHSTVPQLASGENQAGSCRRSQAASGVAVRFCHST